MLCWNSSATALKTTEMATHHPLLRSQDQPEREYEQVTPQKENVKTFSPKCVPTKTEISSMYVIEQRSVFDSQIWTPSTPAHPFVSNPS